MGAERSEIVQCSSLTLWSKLLWRPMWRNYDVIKPVNTCYIEEYLFLFFTLVQKYKIDQEMPELLLKTQVGVFFW